MHLGLVEVTDPDVAEIAATLPAGRLHANPRRRRVRRLGCTATCKALLAAACWKSTGWSCRCSMGPQLTPLNERAGRVTTRGLWNPCNILRRPLTEEHLSPPSTKLGGWFL